MMGCSRKKHLTAMSVVLTGCLLPAMFAVCHGTTASAATSDSTSVRRATGRIIKGREFRYLKPKKTKEKEEKTVQQEQEETERRASGEGTTERRSGGGGSSLFGGVSQLLSWIVIGVIAVVLIAVIIKAIMQFKDDQNTDEKEEAQTADSGGDDQQPLPLLESPPGELPADVYVQKARELAAAGEYRNAIAQLLLGAMSYIERADLIQYRNGLTYNDYTRAVYDDETIYQAMRTMVRVYEPLGFGRRHAMQAHFEQALAEYQAGFHSAKR